MRKILVIGDTQAKPDEDLSYCTSIGKYAADKKPDVIVHIGDHWDFPSLSSYDKGTRSFEGRRLKADIEAGNEAMNNILSPIVQLQERQRNNKKKVYNPELIFCMGNHEHRLSKLSDNTPELHGLIGFEQLNLFKWKVVPFLKPIEIDGIYFVHYLANPFTGKPYGGSAMNQLKTVGKSFVAGHKQCLDIAIRPTLDYNHQLGIICGACYPFDESYKGFQGNNHFRGLIMLHEVNKGFALPMPVSLEYLMKRYGGEQ